jgi:hypothetical protein
VAGERARLLRESAALWRGPLSPDAVYYRVDPGVAGGDPRVWFAARPEDLVAPGAAAWPPAVAVQLLGRGVTVPLSPYDGVFQLACGTSLRVAGGRVRLDMRELDVKALTGMADEATPASGDPGDRIVAALGLAMADASPGGELAGSGEVAGGRAFPVRDDGPPGVAVVGDGGGLGAAALVSAAGLATPRLHVHVGVPVLDRRRGRVQDSVLPAERGKDLRIVDASSQWAQDMAAGPPPVGADPWRPGLELLREAGLEGARVASGQGLTALFTGTLPPQGRLGRGWQMLRFAAPPAQLDGLPWWRAWRPKTWPRPAPPPAAPAVCRDWLLPPVQGLASQVSAGHAYTHLIPAGSPPLVQSIIGTVAGLLESSEPSWNDPVPRATPALIAAHPLVVGTALSLASRGQLAGGFRDGRFVDAPALRALLPPGWRAADVWVYDRQRLLAASVVGRRLATRAQREALAEQVSGSPWVDVQQLRLVLADRDAMLAHAVRLHALMAALGCHRGVLAAHPVPETPA